MKCNTTWEKLNIITDEGEKKEGIAPLIISASRATDIPAFYSNWFFNRLEKGYIKWMNPFGGPPQYVSFSNVRLIVFWSKNPKPIIPFLKIIDEKGINFYFQFTLNDYEKEKFEPGIPNIEERIETFKELSSLIGKEKVIWRFDPLILTNEINVKKLIDKIQLVGNKIYKYTNKLVISFADIFIYSKVKNNLKKSGIHCIDFDENSMKIIGESLKKINEEWGLEIASCAEKIDLSEYGIKHNKCIDDDLIVKLFPNDDKLMRFLRVETDIYGKKIPKKYLKDKGQRKECGCIISKDIGAYNTCPHLCVYCYANFSSKTVWLNYKKHNCNSDSLYI